jgi:iron(III) transport system ATP-binding protein
VMNEGKIVQIGPPTVLYHKPAEEFVANFMGAANFLKGQTLTDSHPAELETLGEVETAHGVWQSLMPKGIRKGDPVLLCIRPENFTLSREKPLAEGNVLEGKVEMATFLGETYDCLVRVVNDEIRVRVHHFVAPQKGENVFLWANPQLCNAIKLD